MDAFDVHPVLIGLSHTAKIDVTFLTESGIAEPPDGPKSDHAPNFQRKLLPSGGSGSMCVTTR